MPTTRKTPAGNAQAKSSKRGKRHPLAPYFGIQVLGNWRDIARAVGEWSKPSDAQWIFRGQENLSWGLESSLERAISKWGLDLNQSPAIEQGLLRQFKRRARSYLNHLPQEDNYLEWLALMQHFGAPTRLTDWTYSFYVAVFFAVEALADTKGAVWALNATWLKKPHTRVLEGNPAYLQTLLEASDRTSGPAWLRVAIDDHSRIALVDVETPLLLNDRIAAQQGTFLCPRDVGKPFGKNLLNTLRQASLDEVRRNFIRYELRLTPAARKEVVLQLQRMNINHATLFPGLGGYAESMRLRLAAPNFLLHSG